MFEVFSVELKEVLTGWIILGVIAGFSGPGKSRTCGGR